MRATPGDFAVAAGKQTLLSAPRPVNGQPVIDARARPSLPPRNYAWLPVPGGRVTGFSASGRGVDAGFSGCRGIGPTAAASTWEFGTDMTVSPVSSRM